MPFIQFQFRRGTGAEWSAANTVLAPGEMGIDTDTYRFKIGDGSTAWNNLVYSPVADGPQGALQYNDGNAIAGSSNLVYTDGETLSIAGNLLPQANVTYSLGNADLRWANLYLAGNTIDLGGSQIKSDFEGAIVLVPPVTVSNPNPTALVINTTGSIVPVETSNGVPNSNAVSNALTDTDSTFGNVFVLGNLTANQSTVRIGNISIVGDTISSADGTITIDPAAPGSTGNLVIEGNLQVKGNVTYIDSQTLTTNDLMINMANNANTSNQADGGGIAVGPVGSEYATLTFDNAANAWVTNLPLSVTGNITASGNIAAGNITATALTGTLATSSQPNITSLGTLSGLSLSGNVTGNLLPSANVTYDLGSATQAWRSLYISGNTLYIADESMAVNSASGIWSFTSNGGEITLGADSIFANSVSATYILGNGALLTGIVTASGNVNFANIANVAYNVDAANISGTVANANYALNAGTAYSVAGANVSGEVANAAYANTAGTAATVTANSQPNITGLGTLTELTVSGNVSANYILGNGSQLTGLPEQYGNSNVAAYLPTYTGNLSADNITVTGVLTGNGAALTELNAANISGTVANANYSATANVAYNIDAANISGTVANANYAAFAGSADSATTAATVTTNAQPNITSVGTLSSLTVTGNVSGNYILGNGSQLTGLPEQYGNSNVAAYLPTYTGNVAANNITITGVYSGNGSALTSLTGANVTGTVANANYAAIANVAYNVDAANISGTVANANFALYSDTVLASSQPNITSVGNLTALTVTGNISGNYITASEEILADRFEGNGYQLTSINAANISGTVANANYAVYSETVLASSQPNITSVGNLTSLTVTGNISGNYILGNGSQLTGIITGNAFGNIIVANANTVTADSASANLTLRAGNAMSIDTDAANNTVTIAQINFSQNFGFVTGNVDQEDDLGLVTLTANQAGDLGTVTVDGYVTPQVFILPTWTVATLPNPAPAAQVIYVSDESGGAVMAFSDGTNWRRCTDRAIVS